MTPEAADRVERLMRVTERATGGAVRFSRAPGGVEVVGGDGEVLGSVEATGATAPSEIVDAALADLAVLVADELGRHDMDALVEQLVAARAAAAGVAERLRVAVSASGIGTAMLDVDGRLIFVNPAFASILGREGDDLIGRFFDGYVRAEDAVEADRLVASMRAGDSSLVEYDASVVGAPTRWVRIHRGRMGSTDGSNPELVQIQDITAERRLAADLRRSEAQSRAALGALDEGVALVDADGTLRSANPATTRIMGGRAEAVVELDAVRRALTSHAVVRGHVVDVAGEHGNHRTVRVSVIPLDDGSGAMVVALTDLTSEERARRMLDATLDVAPVGLAVIDPDRRIVRSNSMFAEQSGRAAEDLIGIDVTELLADASDRADAVARSAEVVSTRELSLRRADPRLVVRPDGTEIWVTTSIALLYDPVEPRGIVATFDVTEERKLQLDLLRYEYLFRHANDIITVLGADGTVMSTSPSMRRVLGYPEGFEMDGGVLSMVHPDDLPAALREFEALLAGAQSTEPITLRIRSYDGDWRYLESVGVNLLDEPAVGGIVLTSRDTTERARLTAELAHSATHDALTDLANRTLLESQLTGALARAIREDRHVGVCYVDLDGFKGVNDTYGHDMGDRLLVEVANRLRSSIRGGDLAARIGGDEFVVMLDPVDGEDDALAAATRLRDAILAGVPAVLPGIRCGASVGVAISGIDDTSASILRRADTALYRAKVAQWSGIEVAGALH